MLVPERQIIINKLMPNFFSDQMSFLSPTNSDKTLKGKVSHSTDLLTQAHLRSSNSVFDH